MPGVGSGPRAARRRPRRRSPPRAPPRTCSRRGACPCRPAPGRPRAPARARPRPPGAARNPPSSGARRPGRARRPCRNIAAHARLSSQSRRRRHDFERIHRRRARRARARCARHSAPPSTATATLPASRSPSVAAGELRRSSACATSPASTGRPSAAIAGRPAQQRQVVLQRLAEAETRDRPRCAIAPDAGGLAGRARARAGMLALPPRRRRNAAPACIVPRLALHVHQADGGIRCRRRPRARPARRARRRR